MVYFQKASATAAAGATGYDDGLRSTSENPKRLLSVICQVQEEPRSADSMLQIWYEQELICEIPTKCLDSCDELGVTQWSTNRLNEVEVGFDIPVGAVVKLAVKAVDFTQTIIGAYRYEISK